jgi:trimeric autotransporter adhesin
LLNNINGSGNTASGVSALLNNTTGSDNTASGLGALASNSTGSHNTAIGFNTGSGNFDASIILGQDATATASNQFVTGSVAYPAGAVNVATVTQTQTWDVIINGVPHKILLA